jgi:hypothetical protein
MKTPFALLATAAALLITTGAAHADVLVSNASVGPLDLDWELPGKRLSLSQFDPLLGTLNAVSFQWSGKMDTRAVLTNFAAGQNTIRYTVSGNLQFDLPLSPTARLEFGPQSGDIALAVDQIVDLQVLLEGSGSGIYQGSLTNFIGEDSFNVRVLADGISAFADEAGGFDSEITTQATAWVQVTYDYTAARNAVPEPGALSLLGLALAAAGIASRRRA